MILALMSLHVAGMSPNKLLFNLIYSLKRYYLNISKPIDINATSKIINNSSSSESSPDASHPRTSDSLNEGLPIKMTRKKFQRK